MKEERKDKMRNEEARAAGRINQQAFEQLGRTAFPLLLLEYNDDTPPASPTKRL
jgi:hypothetical protein